MLDEEDQEELEFDEEEEEDDDNLVYHRSAIRKDEQDVDTNINLMTLVSIMLEDE